MKLNLGCGPDIKDGFINYDRSPGPGGIGLDLTGRLPHEDDSVELIFSEHFLEHITRHEALGLLRECHRVLCPRGRLRITTPDLALLVRDYISGKVDRWKEVWHPRTPAQFLNEGLSEWEHKFTYDLPELLLIFEEAGFKNATPVVHGELEVRGWSGEITVEAYKSDL